MNQSVDLNLTKNPYLDRDRLSKISCTSSSLLSFGLFCSLGDEWIDSMVASESMLCTDDVDDCFSTDAAAGFAIEIFCVALGDIGNVIPSTDDCA